MWNGSSADCPLLHSPAHSLPPLHSPLCPRQVMEEGEALAGKQAELEGMTKKLRGQLRALEGDRDRLQSKLEAEAAEAETQRKARAKAEREAVGGREVAQGELEAQRAQFEAMLQKAKAEQVGGWEGG